jgi:hypothetical protein
LDWEGNEATSLALKAKAVALIMVVVVSRGIGSFAEETKEPKSINNIRENQIANEMEQRDAVVAWPRESVHSGVTPSRRKTTTHGHF